MKSVKLIIVLLLLAAGGAGNAWADHRSHVHFGVMIGPYWGPSYYYPPYPYYYPPYSPPIVIERAAPPVYVEQPAPAAPVAAAQVNYWYYCAAAKGYYPYIGECPGGWQQVLPQPPGPR